MKHEIAIPIPKTKREAYLRTRKGNGLETGVRKR